MDFNEKLQALRKQKSLTQEELAIALCVSRAAVCFGFGVLGLIQLFKRKNVLKVDYDILVLGGFYIVVILAYVLSETVIINYRLVLIEGVLEASYPSSTTMLTLCVMPTAIIQFKNRIKYRALRNIIIFIPVLFTLFMVIGRVILGVHWITDIIGGALLSAGLVRLYKATTETKVKL